MRMRIHYTKAQKEELRRQGLIQENKKLGKTREIFYTKKTRDQKEEDRKEVEKLKREL